MNKLISTIKLILQLLAIWKPAPKPQPRATNEPPVGLDRPDDLIDRL